LRAYRGLPGFRGGAQFSSWLYRIATNVFLSDAARTAPRPDPGVLDPPSAASSHMAFLRHDLDRALARLAPEERLAVVLSYEVGASHEEIATFLGCPLGTAKSHVQRGRQRLSAYLGAWNEEGPHVVTP
jgi:RNA polymerase sigma factor (sigma-70 family)